MVTAAAFARTVVAAALGEAAPFLADLFALLTEYGFLSAKTGFDDVELMPEV
jgi:hypothetical protein